MDQVLQFIRPFDVFDPATLTVLDEAYDKALVTLHHTGQPLVVRETMAVRIFELASQGERNPEILCHAALGFGSWLEVASVGGWYLYFLALRLGKRPDASPFHGVGSFTPGF